MTTGCFISVRDVQYELLRDGYNIVVVTDVPCHLYMRWSLVPPQKHKQAVERRGIYMHTDVYLCFAAYHDNEQEEAGDTLVHTFVKRPWPVCETRYFHFWGSVAGAPCRSTTSVFQLHFAPPPLYAGIACRHNRIVLSTHAIWPTARGGANLAKYGLYQRPQSIQLVRTWLIGTYFIVRAYQNFDTLDVPTGKTITHGRLGIYVTSLTGIVGQLVITKGLWDEPVIEGDFGLQTNETEVLGQVNQADLVLNQYNWIELNAAGIAWVNHKAGDRNQHESYDWQKSAYFDMYSNLWQSQTFTPQNTHTLTSVKLRIKKKGTPGAFYVEIKKADASHNPTGPALASGTKHPDYISTDPWGDWCFIDLWAGFTAEAGIEYCIECHIAGGNASNCVQWIGATATWYPNGYHSISVNGGSSWTAYSQYSTYFIEYETALVGGTNLCLRTSFDNSDVPPTPGQSQEVQFVSAQGEADKQPLLELILD